jgi:hypothetical protein
LELARDLALLGAESTVAASADDVVRADQGWAVHGDRWQELGERMRRHEWEPGRLRQWLCEGLGLGVRGYWLVALCAAVEVYAEAAAAVSIVAEDERVHLVTPLSFARLLRAATEVPLAEGLAEAVEGGPAGRLGLLEVLEPVPGRPLSNRALRLAPAELTALLTNVRAVGTRHSLAAQREPPAAGFAFDEGLVRGAAALLDERGVLCIRSPSPRSARQLALDLASANQTAALFVTARDELPPAAALARLRDGLPVLDLTNCGPAGAPVACLPGLAEVVPRLVVLVPEQASPGDLPTVAVEKLEPAECQRVWAQAVRDAETATGLARQFRVNVPEVRQAVREAAYAQEVAGGGRAEPDAETVASHVRLQGARRMGRLVTLLRSGARLDDLVVPPALRCQLADILAWYRCSGRVYGEMAMDSRNPLGRGLTCLFSGPPGTGKTFAAQCLANGMGLNLYRVDLSQVVSKYIGETEKALATVFEEAEAGHGVLLFDEADALFGKRSEVKDAHDRYANIEVGYLLQRLELFEGVTILATNLRSNLDPAFLRRIRFLLEFPMPDAAMRRRLWEQSLPGPKFRADDLALELFVARFRLSGGSIHNIGLAAAHLAAATPSGRVTTGQLVRATYRELEKAGQGRSPAEFGPLAEHLGEVTQCSAWS